MIHVQEELCSNIVPLEFLKEGKQCKEKASFVLSFVISNLSCLLTILIIIEHNMMNTGPK